MSLALVAAAGFAYARSRQPCGAEVTSLSASRSSSPFLDAEQQAEQPDQNRDELVRTLGGDPAPIGRGARRGRLPLRAVGPGLGVRPGDRGAHPRQPRLHDARRRDACDRGGASRSTTKQSTYDASDRRYLVATMLSDTAPDLVSLDADTGRRVWCVPLGGEHGPAQRPVRDPDPRRRGRGRARPGRRAEGAHRPAVRARRVAGLGAHARCRLRRLPRRHGRRARCWPAAASSSGSSTPRRWRNARRAPRWCCCPPGTGRRSGAGRPRTPRTSHVVGTDPEAGLAVRAGVAGRSGAGPSSGRSTGEGDQEWYAVPGRRGPVRRRPAQRAGAGPRGQPLVGVRRRERSPAVAADRARRAAVPALRLRARQHPAARPRPRPHRRHHRAAHARPAHRGDDLGAAARPTGSTPRTGPTRSPSPTA